MARFSWTVFIGFVVPIILLIVNLAWGYGGILAFICLIVWLGAAVILVYPEEQTA